MTAGDIKFYPFRIVWWPWVPQVNFQFNLQWGWSLNHYLFSLVISPKGPKKVYFEKIVNFNFKKLVKYPPV